MSRARTWVVQVNDSIVGPVVPQARPRGGRFLPHRQLPAGLREYLNLPEDRTKRPVMQDFTRLAELDAIALDECLVRITRRRYHRLLTIVLPDSALPAAARKRPTVPKGVPAIRSLRQLCAHFYADRPDLLNKRIYKGTDCGASISVQLADGRWLHSGAAGWAQLQLGDKILAFTIQTIVEGSEATVDSDPFVLPVPVAEVRTWLVEMEAQADELWREANEDQDEDEVTS